LLLSMLWGSQKARDLLRDPRVLVHGVVTGPDGGAGELKLRGRAVEERDEEVQARYAAAGAEDLGWSPEVGRFHLFEIDVEHVAFLRYDHETGDQYVTTWPPGGGVRPPGHRRHHGRRAGAVRRTAQLSVS